MIRVTRRRILIAVLAFVLFGIGYIAWTLTGLPPVKFILRYGLSPGCEPTGNVMTIEGVEFIEIGPGIFRMGSKFRAKGGDWLGKLCEPLGLPWGQRPKPSDEMPVHWVEFRRGFWIAKTEVTNAQYERFNPEHERSEDSKGDADPVVYVSWEEADRYCKWLAKTVNRRVRLPSEAEWECACQAGSESAFCFGDDMEELAGFAWYDQGFLGTTNEVAMKQPNRWGLFDMHGNVWEWCEDTYHDTYEGAPMDGSSWITGGDVRVRPDAPYRVCRGGSFFYPADGDRFAESCRSASRNRYDPVTDLRYIGFRPAFSSPDD